MKTAALQSTPMITTVIPTFRRPKFLRRAIASVLAQDCRSLQVCVYDNASDDETAAVVASFAATDPRVRYYCHKKNIGGAANFDFALRQINTPFFSILSDDDYLLPGFYRQAYIDLQYYPHAMFWVGMVLNVDTNGLIWDARVDRWKEDGIFFPPQGFMLMTGGMAPAWTGILFRSKVLELGGLPDTQMLGPSDLEFCLRLAARFPYCMKRHPSAVFTLNPQSFSATQPMSSFWPGWQRMLRKIEADKCMDEAFRTKALTVLRSDARRMLFRRGANGIAAGRIDFVREAAKALEVDCGLGGRALLLRMIAKGCELFPLLQRAYTFVYVWAERRIIGSKSALQTKFGNLLQR